MDLLPIAARAAFVFAFYQVLIRVQGKQTVRQGTPFDFVLLLIAGDLVDDVIWGEAAVGVFVTAATTLFLARLITAIVESRRALHSP